MGTRLSSLRLQEAGWHLRETRNELRSQVVNLRFIAAALVFAAAGTALQAEDAPKVLELKDNLAQGELQVLGEAEWVGLPEHELIWEARIDSGATTTSIHALGISEFERDGEDWVRFSLRNDGTDETVEVEREVVRYASIVKRGGDGHHRRPVVMMDLHIGGAQRRIEVNLTDRSGFDYPVLIGRNYLSGTALIDVSRKHVQGEPAPAATE